MTRGYNTKQVDPDAWVLQERNMLRKCLLRMHDYIRLQDLDRQGVGINKLQWGRVSVRMRTTLRAYVDFLEDAGIDPEAEFE